MEYVTDERIETVVVLNRGDSTCLQVDIFYEKSTAQPLVHKRCLQGWHRLNTIGEL